MKTKSRLLLIIRIDVLCNFSTEQTLESTGLSILPTMTLSSSSGNSGSSSIPTSEGGGSEARKKSIVGPVIGGALGGIAFLVILGGAFVIYKRSQTADQINQTTATRYVEFIEFNPTDSTDSIFQETDQTLLGCA